MNYVTPRSSPRLYLIMTLDNIVLSEKNSVSSEVNWTNISLIKYFRFITHVRKAGTIVTAVLSRESQPPRTKEIQVKGQTATALSVTTVLRGQYSSIMASLYLGQYLI